LASSSLTRFSHPGFALILGGPRGSVPSDTQNQSDAVSGLLFARTRCGPDREPARPPRPRELAGSGCQADNSGEEHEEHEGEPQHDKQDHEASVRPGCRRRSAVRHGRAGRMVLRRLIHDPPPDPSASWTVQSDCSHPPHHRAPLDVRSRPSRQDRNARPHPVCQHPLGAERSRAADRRRSQGTIFTTLTASAGEGPRVSNLRLCDWPETSWPSRRRSSVLRRSPPGACSARRRYRRSPILGMRADGPTMRRLTVVASPLASRRPRPDGVT
jgi:hypothetical protein